MVKSEFSKLVMRVRFPLPAPTLFLKWSAPVNKSILSKAAAAAILVILTTLIFSPVLRFDFVNWDDDQYVYNNPAIRSLDTTNVWEWLTRPAAGLYLPVTMASYALDYFFTGNDPSLYHRTNLALHLANALLFFFFLTLFGRDTTVSGLGALVFAWHPAQVESAAWISERKTLLCAFFVFAAWNLGIGVFDRLSGACKKGVLRGGLVVLCSLLALLSKITAVALPILFFLYLFFFERTLFKRLRVAVTLFLIPCFFMGWVTLKLYPDLLAQWKTQNLVLFLAAVGERYADYLRNVFYPAALAVFYPERTGLTAHPLFFAAGSIAIAAACGWLVSRRKIWGFGLLWFFIWLAPVALMNVPVGDRHLYLPLAGLILFLTAVLRVRRRLLCFLLAACAAMCVPLTCHRLSVWQNSESLWQSVLQKNPADFRANFHLANAYEESGRHEAAAELYQKLIERYPGDSHPYINGINLKIAGGDLEAAQSLLNLFRQRFPQEPEVGVLRAALAWKRHEAAKAETLLRQALQQGSTNSTVEYMLGRICFERGDFVAAASFLKGAIEKNTAFTEAYFFLGLSLNAQGQWEEALFVFNQMKKKGLPHGGVDFQKGYALLKLGRRDEALQSDLESIRHEPGFPEAYFHAALLLAQSGRYQESLRYVREAQRLDPANSQYQTFELQAQQKAGYNDADVRIPAA